MIKQYLYSTEIKAAFLAIITFLTPLTANAWGETKLKQNSNCMVDDVNDMVQQCKEGDILIFAPNLFGNEQLPIKIAALACDFNKPIVYNKGGVSCVFTDDRKANW